MQLCQIKLYIYIKIKDKSILINIAMNLYISIYSLLKLLAKCYFSKLRIFFQIPIEIINMHEH